MADYPPQCEGCPFKARSAGFVPPDPILPTTKLVVWGEAPGETEVRLGRGFTGIAGRKLRALIRSAGLQTAWIGDDQQRAATMRSAAAPRAVLPNSGEEVAYRNVVLCRPPRNEYPGDGVAQECLRRHQADLASFQGDLVSPLRQMIAQERGHPERPWIALGANAIEALTGLRVPILKARGSWLPTRWGKWIMTSIHPAFLLHGADDDTKSMAQLTPLLVRDLQRALEPGGLRVPKVTVDAHASTVWTAFHAAQPRLFSVDIEGPPGKTPIVVGVSWSPDEAWVMPWHEEIVPVLRRMFGVATPVLHNASFDLPELQAMGCPLPAKWIDTINTAAVLMPMRGHMSLEAQVLTWVPGTMRWKALVDHNRGWEYEQGAVAEAMALWRRGLASLGRRAPESRWHWYQFYNGLDNAWDLDLLHRHRSELQNQQRWNYYESMLQPLQRPLLEIGGQGLPQDPTVNAVHRTACMRLERMAMGILREIRLDTGMLEQARAEVANLEADREAERLAHLSKRKFSKAEELSKARSRLNTLVARNEAGFNPGSAAQRAELLYKLWELPTITGKSGNPTTNDEAIAELANRIKRGTVKIKKRVGLTDEQVLRVLAALVAINKWSHWRAVYTEGAPAPEEGEPE